MRKLTIDYNGKTYTIGNRYVIAINNYKLKQNPEDKPEYGYTKVRAKLVFKKYVDGEGYGTDYHYGLVFEYPRIWNGFERIEEITLPDAID